MDGYQSAKAIRAIGENYASVPIIALTADTVEEVEKHPEAALFADVLTIPFDPSELQQMLLRYSPGKKIKSSSFKVMPDAETGISSYAVDITKVHKLLKQDSQRIQVFLDKAVSELAILQEKFKAALAASNEEELGDLIHKASLLLDMFSLQELKGLLEQARSFVAEDATQAQAEEVQQKITVAVEQVIASLKKLLEQAK